MIKPFIRFINRTSDFLYRYTPRFTTGHCVMTVWGNHRHFTIIVPGQHIVLRPRQYLVEASYFNWFGEVFEPTLLSAYKIK